MDSLGLGVVSKGRANHRSTNLSLTTVSGQRTSDTPPALIRCSVCLTLGAEVLCWLRYERELRGDLSTCTSDDDAEVLTADLRRAEVQIDGLIAIGREAA